MGRCWSKRRCGCWTKIRGVWTQADINFSETWLSRGGTDIKSTLAPPAFGFEFGFHCCLRKVQRGWFDVMMSWYSQCHGDLHGVWRWPSKLSQFCQSLVCCHTSVCQSLVCCRLDPDFLLCFLHKTDLGPQVRLHRFQPEKAEVQSIRQGTLLPSLHLKTCVFFVSGFLLLLWNLHFMFSSCRCIGPTTFSWALRSEIQTMVIGQLFLRFDHWSVLPETWFYLETIPGLFVPGSSSRPWPTRVPRNSVPRWFKDCPSAISTNSKTCSTSSSDLSSCANFGSFASMTCSF